MWAHTITAFIQEGEGQGRKVGALDLLVGAAQTGSGFLFFPTKIWVYSQRWWVNIL